MNQVTREPSNTLVQYDKNRINSGDVATGTVARVPSPPPHTPIGLNPIAMASLIASVRRPPLLRNRPAADANIHSCDKILQKYAAPLVQYSSSELAFLVSHVVHRRESEITPIRIEGVREGYIALAKLARMYQHLSILQT